MVIFLVGVFLLSNFLAIVLGKPSAEGTRHSILWLQRSTSLQLALIAWWLAGERGWPWSAVGVAIAMSLSFIADLIMAEIIRVPHRVLGGMLVFGVAHSVYVATFGPADAVLQLLFWGAGLSLWGRVVFTSSAGRLMKGGALIYILLLTAMAASTWHLSWLKGIGALCFLASDTVLSLQIFRGQRWRYISEVVWLTYITGQALLVFG